MYSILRTLDTRGILNEKNLNAVLAPNHAALLSYDVYQMIWAPFAHNPFTQESFDRILTAVESTLSEEELIRNRDQILADLLRPRAEAGAGAGAGRTDDADQMVWTSPSPVGIGMFREDEEESSASRPTKCTIP